MLMSTSEARRTVHNEIAEEYDRSRPGYPAAVGADIAFLANLGTGSSILEVGCGTGHATALFAPRGYQITALEPGPALAACTRKRFAGLSNVELIETTFEAWDAGARRFDLVLGASSLHLVAAEHRFTKPAALLRPGGAIAAMWNDREPGDSELHRKIREAHKVHAPSLEFPNDLLGIPVEDHLDASGLYQSVYMCRYRWSFACSAEAYLSFLDTYSTYRMLPALEHAALFGALRRIIDGAGGTVEQGFTTRLWVARRRA